MSKYYYLVAGLPELTLDDTKLSYSVVDFRAEFYPFMTAPDRKLLDLYYLQYDNLNTLKLLKDKEATIDARGIYSSEELLEGISVLEHADSPSDCIFPSYLSNFILAYKTLEEESHLLEGYLAALYYDYAMRSTNKFISAWYSFNFTLNNILVALTARKYKMSNVSSMIVGESLVCEALRTSNARDFGISSEVDYWDQLLKISETEDLLEREKEVDKLRWAWLDEQNFFNYFTVECLFVFLQKLGMIERWISLDKDLGNQKFRSIIAGLKNEVQIPLEFSK